MSKPISLAAVLGAASWLLVACGGGGGSDGVVTVADAVPASASATPEAFTQYAATLREDEQREPLPLVELVPPTSESAEPTPVSR